jgi:hypothetical protein
MIADLHIPPDLEHNLDSFHLESQSGEKLLPYEAVEDENYPRTCNLSVLRPAGSFPGSLHIWVFSGSFPPHYRPAPGCERLYKAGFIQEPLA